MKHDTQPKTKPDPVSDVRRTKFSLSDVLVLFCAAGASLALSRHDIDRVISMFAPHFDGYRYSIGQIIDALPTNLKGVSFLMPFAWAMSVLWVWKSRFNVRALARQPGTLSILVVTFISILVWSAYLCVKIYNEDFVEHILVEGLMFGDFSYLIFQNFVTLAAIMAIWTVELLFLKCPVAVGWREQFGRVFCVVWIAQCIVFLLDHDNRVSLVTIFTTTELLF
jgi:hypothetical protein